MDFKVLHNPLGNSKDHVLDEAACSAVERAVLADRKVREWLAGRRAQIACMKGRPLDALALLDENEGDGVHKKLKEALRASGMWLSQAAVDRVLRAVGELQR